MGVKGQITLKLYLKLLVIETQSMYISVIQKNIGALLVSSLVDSSYNMASIRTLTILFSFLFQNLC